MLRIGRAPAVRVTLTVLLLLAGAGCSGGSGPPESSSPTSTTSPSSTTSVAPPDGLVPVIPGHNDFAADRINLVFASWQWPDADAFGRFLDAAVGWSGTASGFTDAGDLAGEGEEPITGDLGLFGFEPFRSNRHRFNLWVTDREPATPTAWLNTDDEPFDLTDMSIVTLAWDADRVAPGITSVSGIDAQFHDPEPLERLSDDPFANVLVNVQPFNQVESLRLTAHELGHALFALTDEYIGRFGGDGAPRDDTWPSCAQSMETAETWWSEVVGEYDPMIDIWIDEMDAAGLADTFDADALRDENRTGYIGGGCFGDPGSYRSAQDTLMGVSSPAFGITNRRWAERILDLWEGA